jgi:hypothetical protein
MGISTIGANQRNSNPSAAADNLGVGSGGNELRSQAERHINLLWPEKLSTELGSVNHIPNAASCLATRSSPTYHSIRLFMRLRHVLAVATVLLLASNVRADNGSLFDPARHMRVAEVKEGMTGYGLTVFKGTKIERFDVEVLSILHNFNPKYDVILVRCKGANLEHTGSIAGMSGSPVFLKDDQGRERMAGAFAYGWPLMKDPVGGVQPIEYMLDLPQPKKTEPNGPATKGVIPAAQAESAKPRMRWSLDEVVLLPGTTKDSPQQYPFAEWSSLKPNPRLTTGFDDATRLRPLATPLMTAGVSAKVLEQFQPIFNAYGLVPLQAGGMGGSGDAKEALDVELAPGSVLAIPLLGGDLELTAIGTCTEVIDDRVFGFGHAMVNEGFVTLPLGAGQINAVIANLATSFKLGSLTKTRGALHTDQTVGVAGRIGQPPTMVPIKLHVTYADGSLDREFEFTSALHAKFTPLLSTLALTSALSGVKELPQYHTLDYDLKLTFENGRAINVVNTSVNAGPGELFYEIGTPMIAASENPFERVMLKEMTGTLRVTPVARHAQILSVNVPRLKFRPGETIKAYVTYRPWRGAEAIRPVEFELPRDLPEGTYQLIVSDWQKYLADEQLAMPFRFTAESVNDVFALLKDVAAIRHNALYLRLLRQPDGIAVGRTAMPHLPSSRRQVLVGAGRSNITPFVSSDVKTIPTEQVMTGSAQFAIKIDKQAKVEVGNPPAAVPAAKALESQ